MGEGRSSHDDGTFLLPRPRDYFGLWADSQGMELQALANPPKPPVVGSLGAWQGPITDCTAAGGGLGRGEGRARHKTRVCKRKFKAEFSLLGESVRRLYKVSLLSMRV